VIIDIIKVMMALAIILTFPTVAYPCRFSLDNLLFPDKEVAFHPKLQYFLQHPRMRSIILTAVIILASYVLAIFVPSVSTVFGLTGRCLSISFPKESNNYC
jgi:hypothetical protein